MLERWRDMAVFKGATDNGENALTSGDNTFFEQFSRDDVMRAGGGLHRDHNMVISSVKVMELI